MTKALLNAEELDRVLIGLLDNLGGGAGAVGVGGNNDVNTINGLLAHLTGEVVVNYAGNGLLGTNLINSSDVVVDFDFNVGVHVSEIANGSVFAFVSDYDILLGVVQVIEVAIFSRGDEGGVAGIGILTLGAFIHLPQLIVPNQFGL